MELAAASMEAMLEPEVIEDEEFETRDADGIVAIGDERELTNNRTVFRQTTTNARLVSANATYFDEFSERSQKVTLCSGSTRREQLTISQRVL